MTHVATNAPRVIVCDGNQAAAWGVALAKPDVVAVYPITPQSSLVEYVSQFIADGTLTATLMNVEGEHSVLSALQGAMLGGARTYTATSGPGLAFMFEPYMRTPGLRLPMVMSLVTRDGITPQCVWGGQQDAMTVRDVGWIQIYCETVQEVLDTTLMAFRIAEHRDVMLPVNVCHDGNYLSYGVSRLEIPDARQAEAFVGPTDVNWHTALDPARPMAVDPLTGGAGGPGPALFVRYRKSLCAGMEAALRVIKEVHADFADRFGRHHPALVEAYRLDDADRALVTIGSMTGAAKDAVDEARAAGTRVGLLKIKTVRPFPVAAVADALSGVEAIGVIDRAVSFGWNTGPMHQEVLAALARGGRVVPSLGFIGGLAGADITAEHVARAIFDVGRLRDGQAPAGPVWLNETD
ncbi:NADH-dependent phenylglyoxylate dehydrogenase subunit alpha [uncultured Rhodospira sp.]|uniref:NADH-dependent phenylglyoxylate dehydrogenase subunit alpha n=1 Tax=uncultured Rhodospira sp. TaxID=1936189 RepID=UPI002606CBE8|nr:phenylglyoxylate dehydrogenase [uncultured Rhodospira sp.]